MLFCSTGGAQRLGTELEISVSPAPVGSGARAAGMADAFVAIADDATAASWNPAGLVQLEAPEVSFVGSYNGVYEAFASRHHDEFPSDHDSHNVDLNYFSLAYPLPFLIVGRNATVSLNYQRKYDFTREFDFDYHLAGATSLGRVLVDYQHYNFEQKGGLGTWTPAFAVELTHRLSVGASFNFWRSSFLGENGWETTTRVNTHSYFGPDTTLVRTVAREKYENFRAENATLGILWSSGGRWSFGARYDTDFSGTTDYLRRETGFAFTLPSVAFPQPFVNSTASGSRGKRRVHFPDAVALGAAYRASDKLTLSMDVTRMDWSDFYYTQRWDKRYSLVNGELIDNPFKDVDFDPTYTVRFGAEHVFIPKQLGEELPNLWTLRGGVFLDQEPARGDPDEFYGAAVGVGLLTHERFNIDLAYQLRYGNNVNHDFIRGVPGFEEDVFQHRVLLSTVIYF